jgi:hypothetical protein
MNKIEKLLEKSVNFSHNFDKIIESKVRQVATNDLVDLMDEIVKKEVLSKVVELIKALDKDLRMRTLPDLE